MAKELKVIKCPNCGSADATEIKPDYFKCNSCQTVYFLDNSDVNINHNYQNPSIFGKDKAKLIKFAAIAFAILLLLTIISTIFTSRRSSVNHVATPIIIDTAVENQGFSARRTNSYTYLLPSSKIPIVMFLENRDYYSERNKEKNGSYLSFYDPIKKSLIAAEKVDDNDLNSTNFLFRTFSDGNIYIVNDKKVLLKVDKENFQIEDIGKKFFEKNAALQIGVASVNIVSNGYGDGLDLHTNDGKHRYYFPLIEKLYTQDQFYAARQGFNTLLPNAKNKTIHTFTKENSDYPEDKLQLIQVVYKDNGAGPKDAAFNLTWGIDYGDGPGPYTHWDRNNKVLIGSVRKEITRTISFKDLTRDRLYFNPSVLLDDGEALIIQFRANANEDSQFKLQEINRQTGKVLWTMDLANGQSVTNMIKHDGGFIAVQLGGNMLILDQNGKVRDEFKFE